MKRFSLLAMAVGLGTLLTTGRVCAQLPSSQPAVSPYLNLLRQGQSAGLNYYNLVRPEVEFRGGIQQLQSQTTANQQAISGIAGAAALPTTGHRSAFMNYSRYFLNNTAQGGATGRAAAPGGARR